MLPRFATSNLSLIEIEEAKRALKAARTCLSRRALIPEQVATPKGPGILWRNTKCSITVTPQRHATAVAIEHPSASAIIDMSISSDHCPANSQIACRAFLLTAQTWLEAASPYAANPGMQKLRELGRMIATRYDTELENPPPADFRVYAAMDQDPGALSMDVIAGPGERRYAASNHLLAYIRDNAPFCASISQNNDRIEIRPQFFETESGIEEAPDETLRLLALIPENDDRWFV